MYNNIGEKIKKNICDQVYIFRGLVTTKGSESDIEAIMNEITDPKCGDTVAMSYNTRKVYYYDGIKWNLNDYKYSDLVYAYMDLINKRLPRNFKGYNLLFDLYNYRKVAINHCDEDIIKVISVAYNILSEVIYRNIDRDIIYSYSIDYNFQSDSDKVGPMHHFSAIVIINKYDIFLQFGNSQGAWQCERFNKDLDKNPYCSGPINTISIDHKDYNIDYEKELAIQYILNKLSKSKNNK